jgi:hypothetical protein
MQRHPYCALVGSLVWITTASRPDIAYAATVLSRFNDNPELVHWNAARRVLQYLKGTRTWRLTYGEDSAGRGLEGYADADGMSLENCEAISGYVFLIDGGAVYGHQNSRIS